MHCPGHHNTVQKGPILLGHMAKWAARMKASSQGSFVLLSSARVPKFSILSQKQEELMTGDYMENMTWMRGIIWPHQGLQC